MLRAGSAEIGIVSGCQSSFLNAVGGGEDIAEEPQEFLVAVPGSQASVIVPVASLERGRRSGETVPGVAAGLRLGDLIVHLHVRLAVYDARTRLRDPHAGGAVHVFWPLADDGP